MKVLVWLVALAAVGTGAWWFLAGGSSRTAPPKVTYRTAQVDRGEVIEGVAASGTVQPVVLVQVGTQISGVIEKLFADFNSKVKAGQTIAVLDARRLLTQIAQDEAAIARGRADLDRVKAAVVQSRAEAARVRATIPQAASDVDRVRALLDQAERELARQTSLAARKLATQSDLDAATAGRGSLAAQLASAEASVIVTRAQIDASEAAVRQAEAQVAVAEAAIRQSEAQLAGDRVNLDYATILSPVDGVVVARNVDVGQTVAASLSAPTLFLIAQDLTKIQVQTSVPEADVGRVRDGQRVRFTVDAYPDRSFDGAVSQIRLAATTVQNVVTYTVIVEAANADGVLLPGMTANVVFEVARGPAESLRVPATSLRLQVTPDILEGGDAAATEAPAAAATGGMAPRTGTGTSSATATGRRDGGAGAGAGGGGRQRRTRGTVYVQAAENRLRPIAVKIGISDGIVTAVEPVEPGSLEPGADVVTAVVRELAPATTNPFAPTMGAPRGSGGGR